jgi:hypothetical protein
MIVVSVWTHYPDLLELHIAAFRLFMKEHAVDLEYIAVLNSHSDDINTALQHVAERSNVTHLSIDVLPSSDASQHHAHALHQVLHEFLLHPESPLPLRSNDILFLVDSDIFPLQRIDVHKLFDSPLSSPSANAPIINSNKKSNRIISMPQSREGLTYLWPNFLMMQLEDVTMYRNLGFAPVVAQLSPTHKVSLDSGGETFSFLQTYAGRFDHDWIRSSTSPRCENGNAAFCTFFQQQLVATVPSGSNCRTPELLIVTKDQQQPTTGSADVVEQQFYHLGSAGSNWRRCPEEYLSSRRYDLKQYLSNHQQALATAAI